MAWTTSAVSRAFITDLQGNVTAMDLSGAGIDTFKIALFGNGITPDKDASSANAATPSSATIETEVRISIWPD